MNRKLACITLLSSLLLASCTNAGSCLCSESLDFSTSSSALIGDTSVEGETSYRDKHYPYAPEYLETVNPNKPIALTKNYILEHYLDYREHTMFHILEFVITEDKTKSGFEYAASDFFPERFLNKVSNLQGAFTKHEIDDRDYGRYSAVGLSNDGKSRMVYRVEMGMFLVKDMLDLLEYSKTLDHVYFVYGSLGAIGGSIPKEIKAPDGGATEKSQINSRSIRIFDSKHNWLNGYYSEFDICISREASGFNEYSFKDVFFTFSMNSDALFEKIVDKSDIERLIESLPYRDGSERDWYRLTFPYKMEAQFALQLYKELEYNGGVYYMLSPLCEDETLSVNVPQFYLFN